ncbi:FAD-dependent hydroxylase [Lusitaniella coriacea LEGE 07157]|uniref:FAD-dependent hydroxylase n=1 Tax=Lusitaniella coriacea LEGE 07157 TaxID=945747 RepID=A0A8J7E1A0_9CYAN|nr:FAD-dependent hydroxylase [Lusitaniella coriacea]MBE9117551.1 FAD-dependent hydroxylase [Lusitaniella coriacea LEGE 07157]
MALEQLTKTTNPKPQDLDCDLVIVGGGIVGATLACSLKGPGLQVILIEAKTLEAAATRPQAYALSLLSGRIFEGIGVWDDILPKISQYHSIQLSDADYPHILQFQPEDLGTDALGYVAEHGVVLRALQKSLADCPNIRWLCPAEVVGIEDGASAVAIRVKMGAEERQVRAKLLVGADGARSRVRHWADIKTRGWKYWQSCVTFKIQHEAPRNDIAFERFWYSGPMGVLPLPGNRCQIVWTAPHADAKALQALNEEEFIAQLEGRTGGVLGSLKLVSDRVLFPVQLMQCDRYIQSRLALIGDAAHCCHPVGGQGLNLGIRDAAAIAQILQEAQHQGEDIGKHQILKRYERWRKGENLTILGFTDLLDRMFSNRWFPLVVSRRLGLWLLANIRPLKIYALQLMTGLRGRMPKLVTSNKD